MIFDFGAVSSQITLNGNASLDKGQRGYKIARMGKLGERLIIAKLGDPREGGLKIAKQRLSKLKQLKTSKHGREYRTPGTQVQYSTGQPATATATATAPPPPLAVAVAVAGVGDLAPLGIEVEKQGFRMAWLIKGQKFP